MCYPLPYFLTPLSECFVHKFLAQVKAKESFTEKRRYPKIKKGYKTYFANDPQLKKKVLNYWRIERRDFVNFICIVRYSFKYLRISCKWGLWKYLIRVSN